VSREGVTLPAGWFRTEFLPWDEVSGQANGEVELGSGRRVVLPEPARAAAARALSPPTPTGVLAADLAAWGAYTRGDWSPVRAARALLLLAAETGASDIHLESGPSGLLLRFRREGELETVGELDAATGARLTAALKLLAGCLPYRKDIVQEGHIARAGVAADVRASFMPTATGERVALRLFGRLMQLDALGFAPAELARITAALAVRSGLVLVSGASGAGKTTTLYAALGWLAQHRGGAHLSLEDPVEQRLRHAGIPVDQVELRPEAGLTAEAALVGALRQDVDVIAVGEVRTPAEARLALQAAHTGRLVLAGLHAGSAQEASQRLLDLGADPHVLAQTCRAVVHQRLETEPCRACAGAGCTCRGTGRTRVLRADVIVPGEPT
jgi:type II secretory ATPase GspE/PulE/Tfp pilus assembly ATPase PilB-like protein